MEEGLRRWAVDIHEWNPSEIEFDFLLNLLPRDEHKDVTRFTQATDRRRALVSRLLQRKLVQDVLHVPHESNAIARSKQGKPYLAADVLATVSHFPNFNFNVTHHGDLVALASEPLCIVGVDVMTHEMRPGSATRDPRAFVKGFQQYFTEGEWQTINTAAGNDDNALLDQFYRFWCMKEAYIKAVGIGLGFDLPRADFSYEGGNPWASTARVKIDGRDRPDWRFFLHKIIPDGRPQHWVCVARGPPTDALGEVENVKWKERIILAMVKKSLDRSEEPFMYLGIGELVPEDAQAQYQALLLARDHDGEL